jgi:hypothetical protein
MKKISGYSIVFAIEILLFTKYDYAQKHPQNQSTTVKDVQEIAQALPFLGIWRIIEFKSMNDAIGTIQPEDSSRYILYLKLDRIVSLHFNCNRGMARWRAKPGQESNSGTLRFSKIAITKALCPPPGIDEKIARDLAYVRSYVIEDGRLYLSLMADAGIYALDKIASDSTEAVFISPEEGGPRNWVVPKTYEKVILRSGPSASSGRLSTAFQTYPAGCMAHTWIEYSFKYL